MEKTKKNEKNTEIVYVEFSKKFTYSKQPHQLSKDPNISLQAKGLYSIYASFTSKEKKSSWASEEHLRYICGNIYPKGFRKYKKELIDSGWISQKQRIKENGTYGTLLITVYEHPWLNEEFRKKNNIKIFTNYNQNLDDTDGTFSADGKPTEHKKKLL